MERRRAFSSEGGFSVDLKKRDLEEHKRQGKKTALVYK